APSTKSRSAVFQAAGASASLAGAARNTHGGVGQQEAPLVGSEAPTSAGRRSRVACLISTQAPCNSESRFQSSGACGESANAVACKAAMSGLDTRHALQLYLPAWF